MSQGVFSIKSKAFSFSQLSNTHIWDPVAQKRRLRMGMPRPRKIHANDEASAIPPESRSSVMFVAPLDPALPKTGQVYEAVRKAIVGLTLPPGSIINERELCERFQISRTPLREAILQLQSENLVTVLPNSGTYVSRID